MTHKHFSTPSTRATNRVLAVLIAAPLVLTLIMWSVLPSGYERQFCKKNEQPSIKTWQPLKAGFKHFIYAL